MPPYPWTETRLAQAAEAAAEHGCASAVDVESLVAEVRRLRVALGTASGQLGVLSTVLSGSNRPTHAARAWEWSKAARALAGGD